MLQEKFEDTKKAVNRRRNNTMATIKRAKGYILIYKAPYKKLQCELNSPVKNRGLILVLQNSIQFLFQ